MHTKNNTFLSTDERHDLFEFIRRTMYWAAMYPLHLESWAPQRFQKFGQFIELIYELILYLVCIHIAILYGCTFYLNYHSGDLELLVNCLMQIIIYLWTFGMKVYFRRLRSGKLEEVIESLNSRYETRSARGFTYVTMDKCVAMSNKWIKTYVYSCFSGAVFWLIVPITYGDRSLPLTCWYPMDYKKPIIYETIYILQAVAQIQVAAAFSSSSGLHMVLSILISGQYDILFCSLKNVFATVAMRMHLTVEQLIKLRKHQDDQQPELNEFYCSTEKVFAIDKLDLISNQISTTKFHYHFRATFKKCIKHHCYILECLKNMETFFNPIWFLKTGQVILLMCLVAFVSVKSTTANSSFMKNLSLGQYLFLVAWEFLVICYFAQIIFINSQQYGEAILRSPWYLYLSEIKSDMLFFLQRSYRPFKLTAGTVFPLNIDWYRWVISTAFSFLTLLQKMDQRDGNVSI
ncbi:odorant receptor 83a-like [Musca vetustissima]|uniref:odorant receptor 83a-like n=1 Tax=Musca vetustissima TaxID=27455 RepID=UPI002AB6C575|nr:odorant receptor 83a-like [Musca vetustissima]